MHGQCQDFNTGYHSFSFLSLCPASLRDCEDKNRQVVMNCMFYVEKNTYRESLRECIGTSHICQKLVCLPLFIILRNSWETNWFTPQQEDLWVHSQVWIDIRPYVGSHPSSVSTQENDGELLIGSCRLEISKSINAGRFVCVFTGINRKACRDSAIM